MEDSRCDFCGQANTRLLYKKFDNISKTNYNILRCKNCGLVYTNPRLDPEEFVKFYSPAYYGSNKDSKTREKYQLDKIKKVERFKKSGKILDIGCGSGDFLLLAIEKGWEAYGIEISKEVTENLRKILGSNIFVGKSENAPFQEEYFDVITLWHVLEHLVSPLNVIRKIRWWLKKNSLLIVAVPNFNSLQSRLFKEKWFHLDMPRHLYHFTPSVLGRKLEEEGFKVKRINFFSWEHNWAGIYSSICRDLLNKTDLFSKVLRRNIYYSSKILAWLESALKKGGTFEIYAQKG